MIYRTGKTEVDAYYESRRIGQSKLKLLAQGVRKFNMTDEQSAEMYYEEKEFFVIGTGVDAILSYGLETFRELYHVADIAKPSKTVMSVIQQIFDIQVKLKPDNLNTVPAIETIRDHILNACNSHEYYPKWKEDTRIDKIINEGKGYYQSLSDSLGKIVLGLDQFTKIVAIVKSIKENPVFTWMFEPQQGLDVYYQLPIYFVYRGVESKALLDMLRVDHVNQTIQVTDFKTMMGPTSKFPNSLRMRRYDIQGAWYSFAANAWSKQQGLDVQGYRILNPTFIVETTDDGGQGTPMEYEASADLMAIGIYGMKSTTIYHGHNIYGVAAVRNVQNPKIVGIEDLISLYKWHLDNGFQKDKAVVESNGKMMLSWEGVHEVSTG